MMKSRKAISPVIATVILVAVAITIAVAVSYWMSGISGQYTKFEKVEIQSSQCTKSGTGWTVILSLKNSGTSAATLNNVYVNDIMAIDGVLAAGTLTSNVTSTTNFTLNSGASKNVAILVGNTWAGSGSALTSGTAINVKIHSAGGMDYIKLIELV